VIRFDSVPLIGGRTGPPLVLLHGGPLDSREWRRQLDGLADEFVVLAWDMPGCGGSADPPEHFRTRDYADCLPKSVDSSMSSPFAVL
jgi:pimeloyl-ACP methyl ester carboxylesterase